MDADLDLPERVALYFREENGDGGDCVEACFTADAQVRDEGALIRGHDAIRRWKQAARARYRYRVEPLAATRTGDVLQVRARVTGNFPGGAVELDYAITLEDGRIATLQIG